MGLFSRKKNLKVTKEAYEVMIEHAKESYPEECCGILIGNTMTERKIFYVQKSININKERASDRYIIDPMEINLADKEARSQSLELMGFYHSHPDHPDRPSEYDRNMGQAGYSYIIISVKGGTDVSVKSWSFNNEDEPFKEEGLKVS
ncbi:MAG: M67 family metallopeptidase [Thermodesulfobacteriota bacterium]|nr:MAG: M67 family metallopeptidase [Thermodesulfobacteriota bacterium]